MTATRPLAAIDVVLADVTALRVASSREAPGPGRSAVARARQAASAPLLRLNRRTLPAARIASEMGLLGILLPASVSGVARPAAGRHEARCQAARCGRRSAGSDKARSATASAAAEHRARRERSVSSATLVRARCRCVAAIARARRRESAGIPPERSTAASRLNHRRPRSRRGAAVAVCEGLVIGRWYRRPCWPESGGNAMGATLLRVVAAQP
jgi:hypothetical protein